MNQLYIVYAIGLLTALIPVTLLFFFPLYCFKHQDYSKCEKCNVISCPRSAFWKDPQNEPRGLFRFSPVIIFGSVIFGAALLLSLLWFILICVWR